MTIQSKIEQALALAEEASERPWFRGTWSGFCHMDHAHGIGNCKYEYTKVTDNYAKRCVSSAATENMEIISDVDPNNAALIAASRTLLPQLARALGVAEKFIAARRCKTYAGIATPGREVTCHAHDCPRCKALAEIEKLMGVENE